MTSGQFWQDGWELPAGNASSASTGGQAQPDIEEMAWDVLMRPPAANVELRNSLDEMGCPYEVCDMRPNPMHKVWNDPDAEEEGDGMPALAGEASDDELWQAQDEAADEIGDPDFDTDEELGFVDGKTRGSACAEARRRRCLALKRRLATVWHGPSTPAAARWMWTRPFTNRNVALMQTMRPMRRMGMTLVGKGSGTERTAATSISPRLWEWCLGSGRSLPLMRQRGRNTRCLISMTACSMPR